MVHQTSTKDIKKPIPFSGRLRFHPDGLVATPSAKSKGAREIHEEIGRATSLDALYSALRNTAQHLPWVVNDRILCGTEDVIDLISGFSERLTNGEDISMEELEHIPQGEHDENLRDVAIRLLVAYRNLHEQRRNPYGALGKEGLLAHLDIAEHDWDEFLNYPLYVVFSSTPSLAEGMEFVHRQEPIRMNASGMRNLRIPPTKNFTHLMEALRTVAQNHAIAGGELEAMPVKAMFNHYGQEVMGHYRKAISHPTLA